jgi:hypothetical protein
VSVRLTPVAIATLAFVAIATGCGGGDQTSSRPSKNDVLAHRDPTSGRDRREVGPSVSIATYGAQGGGSTDTSAAFKTALDALPPTGGAILVPRGTYVLTTPISVAKNGVTLVGEGKGASVLRYTGSSGSAVSLSGAGNLTLRDLTIDGTGSGGSAGGLHLGSGTSRNDVFRVEIRNFRGPEAWGAWLEGSLDNTFVSADFDSNANHLRLTDDAAHKYPSNQNDFYASKFQGATDPGGTAIAVRDSEGNLFDGSLVQGNQSRTAISVSNTPTGSGPARGNEFDHLWMEQNGNGQTGSVGISLSGADASNLLLSGTIIRDSILLSSTHDNPAVQILVRNTKDTVIAATQSNLGVGLKREGANVRLHLSDNSLTRG